MVIDNPRLAEPFIVYSLRHVLADAPGKQVGGADHISDVRLRPESI